MKMPSEISKIFKETMKRKGLTYKDLYERIPNMKHDRIYKTVNHPEWVYIVDVINIASAIGIPYTEL